MHSPLNSFGYWTLNKYYYYYYMQVSPSSKVRDLGVVFDQYLTVSHDHISGIYKSTHFHLRDIGRIWNLLTFDATAQLIHALITSCLDICNRQYSL